MKSYFFNAEATGDLQTYPTGYDRAYDADSFAAYFAPFLTREGVLGGEDPDACLVYVKEGTTLGVRPGAVYVKGRLAVFDGTETVAVTGDCWVVARMNKTVEVRDFQLLAVGEPVQTDDIWDLELAKVTLTPVAGGYAVALEDTRTFLTSAVRPPNSSVPDAPALGRGVDEGDALAVVDNQDGRKLKLATPEELAAALAGFLAGVNHRHTADDVDGGTFLGEFIFAGGTQASPRDTLIKLLSTGGTNRQFYGSIGTKSNLRNLVLEAGDSGISMGNARVSLRLKAGTAGRTAVQVGIGPVEGDPEWYELFGGHNLPWIEGSYTGNGATNRVVNMGSTPRLLFLFGYGAIGLAAIAVFYVRDGASSSRDGWMIVDPLGSSWTVQGVQAEVAKSKLEVGGTVNGNDSRFLNVNGYTYYYLGLKAL